MDDNQHSFLSFVKVAVQRFREWDTGPIRLISHIDADGISACSLMIKTLNLQNRKYSLSIVQNVSSDFLEKICKEDYGSYIFTDIGSGHIRLISSLFSGKNVLILDHHKTEEVTLSKNIIHVNPTLFGIDGGREVSGAGVVYLFCKEIDEKLKGMAHIALIGALGDVQEENGFLALNNSILVDAVDQGTIRVIRGLRIFGAQTRPLHKILEYSTDPYIPGVTGNESAAIQFLQQVGITPRVGNSWKKIVHLTSEEIKNLIEGIIMKRMGEENPDDVLGNVYLLPHEEKESPFRDAKEFATLLNATGRMQKASLGIGACLGDSKNKQLAMRALIAYKKEIIGALTWFEKGKNPDQIERGKGYLIINAAGYVNYAIIGTIASILSKSEKSKNISYILSLAHMDERLSKVSLRKTNPRSSEDLREIMKELIDGLEGCEAGGHKQAAGGIVPLKWENEIIARAHLILGKKTMEERIDFLE